MNITIEVARKAILIIGKNSKSFKRSDFVDCCKQKFNININKGGVTDILMELVSTGELIYRNKVFFIKEQHKTFHSIIEDPFLFCISDDELNRVLSTIKGKS